MERIVNRVANSPLISIDLKEFIHYTEIVIFDLKNLLYKGFILRENDFRTFIKVNDWTVYRDKNVGLICSVDAIIPVWAYMLLASSLKGYANLVVYGGEDEVEKELINQAVLKCMNRCNLNDAKVVIKGCGHIKNREYAYTQITNKLLPIVSSLMYGEPCSTVPIFKRKNK